METLNSSVTEVINLKQLKERLGISDSTVRKLVKDGKVRAYRWYGKLFFKWSEVLDSLENHVVDPEEFAESAA